MKATQEQIGGSHYKDMPIQPVEFIHKNGIPYIEGSVIKYVSRWRKKGGVEDLKKARHFLDLLIEMEEVKETIGPLWGGEDYTSPELPWPKKYEVGMKFKTAAGSIQTVEEINPDGGLLVPNRWWHDHGEKGVSGCGDEFPEDALVEYLGKD